MQMKRYRKYAWICWCLAAAILTFGGYALMLRSNYIFPFGDTSNLKSDLYYQYIDYFGWYRDQLLNGGNFFYSFSLSLGSNAIGYFMYYLASPLNLLIVFFQHDQLPYFIDLIIALKLGLSAASFFLYAHFRFPKGRSLFHLAGAVGYGLMFYNINQATNLMWLDGVYMLPMILLGVYWMISQRDTRNFGGLMLALSIFCSILFNWYTGYMNCLFAGIYFLYELFLQSIEQKRTAVSQIRLMGSAVVYVLSGVLLSCVLFFPVVLNMMSSKAGFESSNIFQFELTGSLAESLRGMVPGLEYQESGRQISLFCGTAFLILTVAYFSFQKIKLRHRVYSAIFLGVMFLSVYVRPLENIWNGMRYATSYFCRFSYVSTFPVLFLGMYFLCEYCAGPAREVQCVLIRSVLGVVAAFLVMDAAEAFSEMRTVIFVIAVCGFLVWIGLSNRRLGAVVLAAVVCVEMVQAGTLTQISQFASADSAQNYPNYVRQQTELVQSIQAEDTEPFYRMDQTMNRQFSNSGISSALNDGLAYGFSGVATYSSTASDAVQNYLTQCGYYAGGFFIQPYGEPILPSDSLFGVRYVMSPSPIPGFEKVESLSQGLNGKDVYRNPWALPLGFAVSGDALAELEATENRFAFQNQIYTKLLGRSCELFQPAKAELTVEDGVLTVRLPQQADAEDILYLYVSGDMPQNMEVKVDGSYRTRYNSWLSYEMMCAGTAGQDHVVTFTNVGDLAPENFPLHAAYLDMGEFRAAIDELKANSFQTHLFEDGKVSGTYDAKESGNLLLTIPYDSGWKITVNGEKTNAKKGAGLFLTIPVQAGTNEVQLNYSLPGLVPGAVLSVMGLGLLILSQSKLVNRRRKTS